MRKPLVVLSAVLALVLSSSLAAQQARTGVVQVVVEESMGMVGGILVRSSGQSARTDGAGRARLTLPVGRHVVTFMRIGYLPTQAPVVVIADSLVTLQVTITMERMVMLEDVKVSATRTEKLAGETPIRVEVVDEMEVDENTLMAPSGITMLLNETPGIRVQSASPTLGTGSVRILGLPGQYTVMLADGLPLYGGGASAIGPLDISPVDLQRVEIIKGAASALYGAQALGGVINLVSKPASGKSEFLLNRRMLGVTDAAMWTSRRWDSGVGFSLLTSGSAQDHADIDGDGWFDQARATRGSVRPRLTVSDASGRTFFVTAGYGVDNRRGGTVNGGGLNPYEEELLSRRGDIGATARVPLRDSGSVAIRTSFATSLRQRKFGPGSKEKDLNSTGFLEVTRSFVSVKATTVIGSAAQLDGFENQRNRDYDHHWFTPSLFATTERTLGPVTVSLSARGDNHPDAGFRLTERVAILAKPTAGWSVRASAGTGYAPPTASIEETEAIGLQRIQAGDTLRYERSFGTMLDINGKLAGAEVLVTAYQSQIARAIQLADANNNTGNGVIRNAAGTTRIGGVEGAAIWRFVGGKFLATYGYSRGTRTDALTETREPIPLLPRHRVGGDLMFEKEKEYRLGIEGIYYAKQSLDDNPYRTESKPYVYLMAIAMRQFGRLELVANFENLLDVKQTDTHPLLLPVATTGGRITTDVWAPLEGFMANVAIRYRW